MGSRAAAISTISICAALYAVAIALTAPIPTPWGVGHFRPGVVVPALFAVVSGAWVAGLGAGIGTFVGSFILSAAGTGLGPIGSIFSGTPGNFVGFYVLGWFVSKYRSWRSFIIGSFVALLVGNLIAAGGVMFYLSFIVPRWSAWTLTVKFATILGLTLFWMVTMLPFVIGLVPLLAKAVSRIPGQPFVLVRTTELSWSKASDLLYPSVGVALLLALMYLGVMFTPIGDALFAMVVTPGLVFWVKTLFLVVASIVVVFGVAASLVVSRRSVSSSR